ncbi:MAG: MFS transporter [SAR324 cluster bacterium]|jgi:MFS family permease|nr:MFS transporter [SAR324 cluster bacterium]
MTEDVDRQNNKASRIYPAIFMTASLGGLSFLAFSNGLLLAYFSRLKIASSEILFLLALPSILQFLLVLIFSYLSDRVGKKVIGASGLLCSASAFYLFWQAGFTEGFWRHGLTVMGVIFFGIGTAMTFSNWFALLHPLVPQQRRGRFFGRLRLTWQGVGFLFSLLVFYLLEQNPGLEVYHWVLGALIFFLMIRIPIFWSIPEVEKSSPSELSFFQALVKVLRIPGYLPFCAYCFLLMLFTGACPMIFSLLEKDVLHFTDDRIVLIGNLMALGGMLGFIVGGRMVDRFGTKYVFLCCHFGFSAVLLLVLTRGVLMIPPVILMALLTAGFGMIQAASGIAMTSETLSLIPSENKSLSSGLWMTLYTGGTGLSGTLFSQLLELGVFSTDWTWMGYQMSIYDGLLLICGGMILLLTVTLGLIPSMIRRKAEWIPQVS